MKQNQWNRGSFYIEIMVALLMVGVLATSFLPLLRSLVTKTLMMRRYTYLESIAEYCSDYVFRWATLSVTEKGVSLNSFHDNESLEPNGETRVNALKWAVPPKLISTYLSDHYKVSITFHDTLTRHNSAGVRIHVWYDENLNSLRDTGELQLEFSTLVTEKEAA